MTIASVLLCVCSVPFPGARTPAQQQSAEAGLNAPSAEFEAGLKALQGNNFEEALRHLTLAEQLAPVDARVHNFRAIALEGLERHDQASAEFENAIRLDPNMEDAYRGLGFLEWTEHRLPPAVEHLRHALVLSPGDLFARYYLGRALLEQGDLPRALGELSRSHDLWPNDPSFLIQIGSRYLSAQREADARMALERASDLSLTTNQTAQAASLLSTARDAQRAAALLQKFCTTTEPNPPEWALFDLALARLMAGGYQDAAAAAQAYLSSASRQMSSRGTGEAWAIVGISAARRGDSAVALDALRKHTQLSPDREEAWLNLTLELMSLGRSDDAVSAAQNGIANLPKSYALHLRLGATYLAAARYLDAERVFRELVNAGDPLPLSYAGLAQVLLRTGRAEEASSELLAAQQTIGDNFLLSYFRGLALQRAGNAAEALRAYRQAMAQNPGSVEAQLGVASTELKLNSVRESIAQLNDVLRIDPSNVQAIRLLSQAYRREGDVASATKYANKAGTEVEASPDSTLLGDFVLPEWMSPEKGAASR